MKNIYEFTIQQLKNYTLSFEKKAQFLNKPWTLVDEDHEIQRLIFKKDKELIVSKNGEVQIGKWEYLPEANSLLITRGGKTIMCNEGFLNEAILIFKKDGTDNNFFVLVNENEVPDLDAVNYLKTLRYRTLGIKYGNLIDGRLLEIHSPYGNGVFTGDSVTIDHEPAVDGTYTVEKSNKKYVIENSAIAKIFHLVEYKTSFGYILVVEQRQQYNIRKGDKVFRKGEPISDGKYRLNGVGKISVKEGVVVKKPWF